MKGVELKKQWIATKETTDLGDGNLESEVCSCFRIPILKGARSDLAFSVLIYSFLLLLCQFI